MSGKKKKMSLEARFHEECSKKVLAIADGKMVINRQTVGHIHWFEDSPDAGDPKCICSWCGKIIGADEIPIRLFVERKGS